MHYQSSNRKMRIMAIDDSHLILEIVKHALQDEFDVFTYNSSPEAILNIRTIQPDLILLDYEMPDMNGMDVMRWICENKLNTVIPVIFLTAYQDMQFELEAFQLGAVDYIHKPFTPQLLTKRIQVHISHMRSQVELSLKNYDLADAVAEKTSIIKELQSALIYTLSDLVETRDQCTGGHVQRATDYYRVILEAIRNKQAYQKLLKGLDDELVLQAVQLHDIGKVAIPDAILLKPGKLTVDEFEIMKTHAEIGYRSLLKAMKLTQSKELLNFSAIIALTHHERWDGTGYPYAIAGEAIPLIGRIMAIVDVYDAIVSVRPYKVAMPHTEAIKEIVDGRGSHFDPILVDVVVEIQSKLQEISKQ